MTENYCMKHQFEKYRVDYIILLLVCTGIRIYHIETIDLWTDEIHHFFTLHVLSNMHNMVLNVRKTAPYALVDILFKAVVPEPLLYSYNFLPRIPALIFGLCSVVILYDAFRRYLGIIPAFIVGCFSCTAYPLIIYSIRSRVYSMTQFFLSIYIWLYVSIIKRISQKKIILLFLSSLIGFYTYPYLFFVICSLYFCLFIYLYINGQKQHLKLLLSTFILFFLISVTLLVFMMHSFSHHIYTTIPMSKDFFFTSLKGILSYFSNNSYLLVFLSFLAPIFNLFYFYKGKAEPNFIYLLWICSLILILLHLFIVTNTRNAFNPRHVTFMVVPFIACISLVFYNVYKNLDSIIINRYPQLSPIMLKVVFFALVIIVVSTTRDFRYYIKSGANYHAGAGNYTENIDFINHKLDEIDKNNSILLLCYNDTPTYQFYHYRSKKRVVLFDKLKHIEYSSEDHMDSLHIGFILNKKIDIAGIPFSTLNKFSVSQNSRMTLFLSNNSIQSTDIDSFVENHIQIICEIG